MNMTRLIAVLAGSLLAAAAWAQAPGKPLNLKLPPSDVPVSSATTAKPASSAPGVYYGDTSGRMGHRTADAAPACDDSRFNQTQVHGSVSTGVVSGSHIGTGMWNAGTVNLSKNFGSCDDPSGSVDVSISVSKGQFNGHRRGY